VLVEDGMHALLQAFHGAGGGEAEVEVDHHFARDHVGGAGAAVDVGHLPGGRQEVFVARVPLFGHQFGQRRAAWWMGLRASCG
jgi:hypothetical protein